MRHVTGGVLFHLYPRHRKNHVVTLICYHVGSMRRRDSFRGDMEAAKRHCRTLAQKVTTGAALHLSPVDVRVWTATKEAAAQVGRPPDVIVREYLEALKILDRRGTVLEAARLLRKLRAADFPAITVAALCDELLTHLAAMRREKLTIDSLRSIHVSLKKAMGSVSLRDVTTADLQKHLGALHFASRTINNHRAGIIRTWNYAKGRYLPEGEPSAAEGLDQFSGGDRGAVEIFRPWEFTALLGWLAERVRTARNVREKLRYGGLLRCLLLGGFAGIRTIELCRAEASAIRIDSVSPDYPHGYIEIGLGVAKRHRTAKRRIIPIQANLAEWITAHPFPSGPVTTYRHPPSLARAITDHIDALNAARTQQRLPTIGRPANGARHSYASYRLPVLRSAASLAIEMNNSAKEIEENYYELVRPADVTAWWSIRPPANIVQLDLPSIGT